MATQLREVLNRFEGQTAPIALNVMAREMNLEVGMLHSMIDYWVRKGKLREVSGEGKTCGTCGIKTACPFIVAMPRYYEVVTDDSPTDDEPPCSCGGSCHV
jgi:hypothetical protein